MSRLFIIVTAAGSGTRLHCAGPKALVEVGSRSILALGLEHLPPCEAVAVSAPADYLEEFSRIAAGFPRLSPSLPSSAPSAAATGPLVVPGGASRQASVLAALRVIEQLAAPIRDDDAVLVHDAARPFTPAEVFTRVLAPLQAGYQAAIPVVPVVDTIKAVHSQHGLHALAPYETNPTDALPLTPTDTLPHPEWEVVETTLNRSCLRAAQTPQGFLLKTLIALHQRFAANATEETGSFGDDAGMAEAAGIPVATVAGSLLSHKITTPFDLKFALLWDSARS